ncbi:MAG TPA: TMEM175 family protein [Xanthobacteraceae bacterium]
MRLFRRFTQGELRLTRIEAFSDGVFAVAVTLLVLDLKVPVLQDHADVRELGQALLDQLPKFVSWLISFVIVCKFWLNHHHVLGLARHADYGFVWLNSIFLLGQSFIPFPTAMVGEYPGNPLAVSFFGCVFALNTFLFMGLHAHIERRLIKPELAALQDPHGFRKGLVGPLSYLIGAAAAWVYTPAAFVIYALTPIFYITPPQGHGGAQKGKKAGER